MTTRDVGQATTEIDLQHARCLTDAMALLRHDQTSDPGRPHAVLGHELRLPQSVPLWRHVTRDGRELQPVPHHGERLVVHGFEPSGASFLVHRDGEPHVRRGPALTLRRVAGPAEELLVVFSDDVGDRPVP